MYEVGNDVTPQNPLSTCTTMPNSQLDLKREWDKGPRCGAFEKWMACGEGCDLYNVRPEDRWNSDWCEVCDATPSPYGFNCDEGCPLIEEAMVHTFSNLLRYLDYQSALNLCATNSSLYKRLYLEPSARQPYQEDTVSWDEADRNYALLRQKRYRWHCFELAFKIIKMKKGYVVGGDIRARMRKACDNDIP